MYVWKRLCTALPIKDKISSINILFKVDGNQNPRTYKCYSRGGKTHFEFYRTGFI